MTTQTDKRIFFSWDFEDSDYEWSSTLEAAKQFVDEKLRDCDDMYCTENVHRSFIINTETNAVYRPKWHEDDNVKNHQCPHGFGACPEGGPEYCENPIFDGDVGSPTECQDENPWEHGDWKSVGKIVWDAFGEQDLPPSESISDTATSG